MKRIRIVRNCLYCKKPFEAYESQNKRYCNQTCCAHGRGRGIHTSIKKNCLECGKEFKTYPSVNKKFCTSQCVAIYYGRQRRQGNQGQYGSNERISENGDRVLINRWLMEKKLGRKLKTTEIVHHIDLDRKNNPEDCSNYYIYNGKREHNKGHGSLNPIVSALIKEGKINFEDGKYILMGEVKTKQPK